MSQNQSRVRTREIILQPDKLALGQLKSYEYLGGGKGGIGSIDVKL